MYYEQLMGYDKMYEFPEVLKDVCTTYYDASEAGSIYMRAPMKVRCSYSVYKALKDYVFLKNGISVQSAFGLTTTENRVSERKLSPSTAQVIVISKAGYVCGGIYDADLQTMKAIDLRNCECEGIWLPLLPDILENKEAMTLYEKMQVFLLKESYEDQEKKEFALLLAKFSDNVFQRTILKGTNADIKLSINDAGKTRPIKNDSSKYLLKNGFGNFVFFKSLAGNATKNNTSELKTLKSLYKMGQNLTYEEEQMIPVFDDNWNVPMEVIKMARLIKNTSGESEPMRNFMLHGPAGTGKTTDARLLASVLGLPYEKITCNADMEIFDFIGQVLPENNEMNKELPSVYDIAFDLETSYYKLTGEKMKPEFIDETECFRILIEKIKKSSSSGFRYMDTPFIKAMKNGWLIEIQEPTVIVRPGVLVGLNSLLDGVGSITLPTGEIVNRHPNTVVVVTTNLNYRGCEDLNESVISRMDMTFEIDELSLDEMVARVQKRTRFEDIVLLREMAKIVMDIQEYLKKNDIRGGVCGLRELLAWAKAVKIEGKDSAYENAMPCIMQKATFDPEERQAIITSFLQSSSIAAMI